TARSFDRCDQQGLPAARRGAALPQRSLPARAQYRWQLALGQARGRARRRLRSDCGGLFPRFRLHGDGLAIAGENHDCILATLSGGTRLPQGIACSSAAASCRTRWSAAGLAAICTPIGRPVVCMESGSDTAGVPMILWGIVYWQGILNISSIRLL